MLVQKSPTLPSFLLPLCKITAYSFYVSMQMTMGPFYFFNETLSIRARAHAEF